MERGMPAADLAAGAAQVVELSDDERERSDAPPPAKRSRGSAACSDAADASGGGRPRSCKSPFELLRVRALPASANAAPHVRALKDLVVGPDIELALVSNYMIDLPWLLSACPALACARSVMLVHGERGQGEALLQAGAATLFDAAVDVTLHAPPLPIPYGTHHSKAFILVYKCGVRVIIHTANLIHGDCNNKTQGMWHQDFPLKLHTKLDDGGTRSRPLFEKQLVGYLLALQLPAHAQTRLINALVRFDFSGARVQLVASVPGYHSGAALQRWGHMSLRKQLNEHVFTNRGSSGEDGKADRGEGDHFVCQFSSLGSLQQKWLHEEFLASLAAGKAADADQKLAALKMPRQPRSQLHLVWPTVEEVRNSVEGWVAGVSIPGYAANVRRDFLSQHWCRFSGALGRRHAMPHIKTFLRYRPAPRDGEVLWALLTSHNLSKAAWGALQKKDSQLMVRSYELGVLFLPGLEAEYRKSAAAFGFDAPSATQAQPPSCAEAIAARRSDEGKSESVMPSMFSAALKRSYTPHPFSFAAAASLSSPRPRGEREGVVELPVPYALPPARYTSEDRPWVADDVYREVDSMGKTSLTMQVRMYGHAEQPDEVD